MSRSVFSKKRRLKIIKSQQSQIARWSIQKNKSKVVCKEVKVDKERTKSKTKIETSKRTVSQKSRKASLTKIQSTKALISRKTETKPEPIREIVEQDDEPRKLPKGPKAKREAKFEQKQTKTKNSRSTKRAQSEQKINKENKKSFDTNIKPIEFVVEETVKSKHQSKGKQQKHIRNKSAKNVKEDQFKISKSYDLKGKRFKCKIQKNISQLNDTKASKNKEQLLAGKKREHKHQDKQGIKRKKLDKSHKQK